MKNLWKKFDSGEALTTQEVKELIASSEGGLLFLQERGERFLIYKVIADLETLKNFLFLRRNF